MERKYPDRATALKELELAGKLNPGPWTGHSKNTGLACKYIAARCPGLDEEKAYVLGLLHDIGRRVGFVKCRHITEGYYYCMEKGWEDAAKVCLTHSFMIREIDSEIAPWDVPQKDYVFARHFIETAEYDDYDLLIQLCDNLALDFGFVMLEKRFIDVARRYGTNAWSVPRWNQVFELKNKFEQEMGCSVYDVLPEVKDTTFKEIVPFMPKLKRN